MKNINRNMTGDTALNWIAIKKLQLSEVRDPPYGIFYINLNL